MRKRVSAAVATGALALTGLAIPAAHAAPAEEEIKLSNIKVNGGKDVAIGTGNKKFTLTFDASHSSNIEANPSISAWKGSSGILLPDGFLRDQCKEVSATKSSCTATFNVNPQDYDIDNSEAGTWSTEVFISAQYPSSAYLDKSNIKSFKVLRAAKLTTNAAPEPIKKGKTLTVTGALTRANWDTFKYGGYTAQSVKLQFKKQGAATYTDVKTVKSDSRGNLKTTVKATVDGSYRYSFAGTSTTPAVNASGDAVNVT
ncbi:calcium-binding protein [Streptomyces sp. NPDC059816]|uniref:calcium-binding protein n=1 Tax=Streptomyces sp. NPDC059816 TaxID=3346960 RepID=UPI0036694351